MSNAGARPVLVLGGGVNGAAIARELVLRGIPVRLVDVADLASGASSRSSRLIHGGLRYLEYGEFSLVRESLEERRRLLRQAPHLVRRLRLFLPAETMWSGWLPAIRKLLGWERSGPPRPRGLRLIQFGCWLYDRYAADPDTTRGRAHRLDDPNAPNVDADRYTALCSFEDGQILFPERLVVELLEDARRAADESGVEFSIHTRSLARCEGVEVVVEPLDDSAADSPSFRFAPAAIVNATGAWVDRTLEKLDRHSGQRLIGGKRGSHLVVVHDGLRKALGGDGVYAEADDGRPVFLLPMEDVSLIGTTDLPDDDPPESAVAGEAEIEYLLRATRRVFPNLDIGAADVLLHYCGVRPLPRADATSPAAVTRRHMLYEHHDAATTMVSVIGGKITTCRSLAEEAGNRLVEKLGLCAPLDSSRDRPLPGGENYPGTNEEIDTAIAKIAAKSGMTEDAVKAVWRLYGARTEAVLDEIIAWELEDVNDRFDGLPLPFALARYTIRREWARRLEDLVERRLMLLYEPGLKSSHLEQLARILVDEGLLREAEIATAIEQYTQRLQRLYDRRLSA